METSQHDGLSALRGCSLVIADDTPAPQAPPKGPARWRIVLTGIVVVVAPLLALLSPFLTITVVIVPVMALGVSTLAIGMRARRPQIIAPAEVRIEKAETAAYRDPDRPTVRLLVDGEPAEGERLEGVLLGELPAYRGSSSYGLAIVTSARVVSVGTCPTLAHARAAAQALDDLLGLPSHAYETPATSWPFSMAGRELPVPGCGALLVAIGGTVALPILLLSGESVERGSWTVALEAFLVGVILVVLDRLCLRVLSAPSGEGPRELEGAIAAVRRDRDRTSG